MKENTSAYKWFLRFLAGLNLISMLTVAVYLVWQPEGILINGLANIWLLTLWLGLAAIMLNPVPSWKDIVYAIFLGIYALMHSIFSYAGYVAPDYDSNLYMITSGGNLMLAMMAGFGYCVIPIKRHNEKKPAFTTLSWIGIVFLLAFGSLVTYLGIDPVGYTYIEALEYIEFMYMFCGLALISSVFGIRMLKRCQIRWIKNPLILVFAFLIIINTSAFVYQIDIAFAASRANEAEMNGIRFSDVRLDYSNGESGKRGLYEEIQLESDTYPAPLSLAMMLCGNRQEKDNMVVTYNAGNWHENTKDGIVLYYDVYAPANADSKTPVVINIHGFTSPRNWFDTYAQFVALGYTVLDVQYGLDSESVNEATPNTPNEVLNAPENFDYWIKDMEHLFRYLKEHEQELNIDLKNVFLYGHSAGCNMAVGMDNLLLGKGYENYLGETEYATYNQFAEFYTGEAASASVSDFVDIRGMILLYGINGRYFADGLDPILFATGTTDHVVTYDCARQINKIRATYDIDHFYILDAGLAAHSFDNRASYELCNQVTNRYIEMFVKRFGILE